MVRGRRSTATPVSFQEAPEVESIAKGLIEKNHGHLANANIAYVFRYGKWMSKGKVRGGTAEVVTPKHKHLNGFDFIIVINGTEFSRMKNEQKEALIDHELCHCGISDKDKWCIWPHDVEDFAAVVARHGLWQSDVKHYGEHCVEAARQMTIFDQQTQEKTPKQSRKQAQAQEQTPMAAGAVN